MRKIQFRWASVGIALGIWLAALAPAQGQNPGEAAAPAERSNPVTKTLGGTQFWSDELVFRGWRIQRNVFSAHYRLLDEHDYRHAAGSFDECRKRLDEIRRERMLPPLGGPVVITMHGLIRSRDMMEGIGNYLEVEGDFTWLNVSYASTRRTLDDHAASLARVLGHLDGVTEIHFVCHSLGNLVVRRYLGEASAEQPRWKVDSRIERMVMLAPPNNGARFAQFFKDNKLFDLVMGPSGKQLAAEWSAVERRLAVPDFEFGIIAGSKSSGRLVNPLLDGEDDLVVSVEETRLAGACDFLVVPSSHGELMDDSQVRRCVRRFLEEGCFLSADKRMPITKEAVPGEQPARPRSGP